MTNKLISLVIITFILSTGHSYSDEGFLFPKEKPSIFKKIKKDSAESFPSSLPQKKPLINEKEEPKKPQYSENYAIKDRAIQAIINLAGMADVEKISEDK